MKFLVDARTERAYLQTRYNHPVEPVGLDLTKGPLSTRRPANLGLFLNRRPPALVPSDSFRVLHNAKLQLAGFFLPCTPSHRGKRVAPSFRFYGFCFSARTYFIPLRGIVKGRGNEGLAFLYSGVDYLWCGIMDAVRWVSGTSVHP